MSRIVSLVHPLTGCKCDKNQSFNTETVNIFFCSGRFISNKERPYSDIKNTEANHLDEVINYFALRM
jgi:hypothetical protein